jgi:lipoate synthase
MTLEVLAGDFKGKTELVDTVLEADPDVFAHNLETVPRLSRAVRVQASYPRSYKILEHARRQGAVTKTGIMLGLGETRDEVEQVITEVAQLGVEILTLGQYLAPSKQHLAIERYVHPTEFAELERFERHAQQTIQEIERQLADLEEFLAPLRQLWTGAAAQAWAEYQALPPQERENLVPSPSTGPRRSKHAN